MATIIDSLILALNLDPADFKKGAAEVDKTLDKTKESTAKYGKETEAVSKNASSFISKLRGEVIMLFAAFTAGKGIKEFIQDTVTTNAGLARLSLTLDQTVQSLSAWRGAAEMFGGSGDAATASWQGFTRQVETMALTGETSLYPVLRALNIGMLDLVDTSGKMRPMTDIYLRLSAAVQGMDKARAATLLGMLGIDPGTINVLIQGRAATQALLDQLKAYADASAASAKATLPLQMAWNNLKLQSSALGMQMLTVAAPAILAVLGALTQFVSYLQAHPALAKAIFLGLAAAVAVLTGWLIAAGLAALGVTLPILLIVAAIGAVIAIGYLMYDDWKTWTEGGKSMFGGFYQYITSTFGKFGSDFGKWFSSAFQVIKDLGQIVAATMSLILGVITLNGPMIKQAWAVLWKSCGDLLPHFVTATLNTLQMLWDGIKAAFKATVDFFENRVNSVWNAVFGHDLFVITPTFTPGGASWGKEGDAGEVASPLAPVAGGVSAHPSDNNLGNLRAVGASTGYRTFSSLDEGIRALAADLRYKQRVHGLNTINELVARYASGPGDNPQAYAADVSRTTGYGPNQPLDLNDNVVLAKVISAFSKHEKGAKNQTPPSVVLSALTNVPSIKVPSPVGAPGAAIKVPSPVGAPGAAVASTIHNNQRISNSTATHSTTVGDVYINTAAEDAAGIAKSIRPAIERYSFGVSAPNGAS